jgi:hypothetical protein
MPALGRLRHRWLVVVTAPLGGEDQIDGVVVG